MKKAKEILAEVDLAVLVIDAAVGMSAQDRELENAFREKKLPYILVYNKSDLLSEVPADTEHSVHVSARTGQGIYGLKDRIAALGKPEKTEKQIAADLVNPGDTVVLVIPIDDAAPKGRLILPQQQVIRDLLEAGCSVACCRDTELAGTLEALKAPPALVITDSQAFGRVSKIVPADVPLTSFSILFARYKGELSSLMRGAETLKNLGDGDRVLISEGCTHHRQCGDIGTEKLPNWIRAYCGAEPEFSFTSGGEFPDDPGAYKVVVHCGGCMLNEREMQSRIERAERADVPIVNYGIAIAAMHGILDRATAPLKGKGL